MARPAVFPRWATSNLNNGPLGGPNVLEPAEIKKDSGWDAEELPPREYFNWLGRLTYDWLVYLDSVASDTLLKSSNLSDLPSPATARTNLGLGTAATYTVGTGSGNLPTVAQSDAKYLIKASNLSDLTNSATARSNLGLGTAALASTGTGAANVPTITDADGRYARRANNLSDLANVVTARTNLGLGNSATRNVGAGVGEVLDASTGDLRYLLKANNLSDLVSAASARANLGLGNSAQLNVGTTAGTVCAGDDPRITNAEPSSSFNDRSVTADGWLELPGGLLIQWGRLSTANGNGNKVFPKTFGSVFSITATQSSGGVLHWGMTARSTTGFTMGVINAGGATSYDYIAIGTV